MTDYPLYPYVAYWQLALAPDRDRASSVIEAFMSDIGTRWSRERLRADWLRQLGRNQDWEAFEREYRGFAVDDPELTCYALQARLALHKDNGALKEARALWFQGSAQPDSCAPLFDTMLRQGLLEEDDVWARIRLALEAGNVSFVRQLVGYLPAGKRPDPRAVRSRGARPPALSRAPAGQVKTRAERELAMFAAVRLASPCRQWRRPASRRSQIAVLRRGTGYVWGQLALAGAMKHRPEALDWFARAGDAPQRPPAQLEGARGAAQEEWGTVTPAHRRDVAPRSGSCRCGATGKPVR